MRFLAKSGRMVEICCAVECEKETEGDRGRREVRWYRKVVRDVVSSHYSLPAQWLNPLFRKVESKREILAAHGLTTIPRLDSTLRNARGRSLLNSCRDDQ